MCPGFPLSDLSQMQGDTGSVSGMEGPVIFRGNLWNGNRVEDPGQVSEPRTLLLGREVGEDFVSRRQETPQQQQADTETELRDNPPADSQIDTGFFRVPPWSRSELLPKVLIPLQATSTTMNHQPPAPPPHSLASLYTRGKKEEPGFLTSHGAFSRDTSSSTRGFWAPRVWR